MGGQHPLFWDSCDGNCCCKKSPEVVTLLLLPVPFLILAPGLLMALYWLCSENTPWKGTSYWVTAVVAPRSRQHVARQELSICKALLPQLRKSSKPWMQGTNFNKPITGKGASCLPFSDCVYHPAVPCCISKLILYPWLEFMPPAS